MRRDGERRRPDKTILHIGGGGAVDLIGPDLDIARLAGAQIESLDNAADAAGTRGRRPDDVVVHRIGRGPTAFASGNSNPRAAGNATKTSHAGATRSAI